MPTIEVEEWPVRRDFGLNVARGGVAYHEIRHVFGYNPDVDSGSEETVWTAGGLYAHVSAPSLMAVSSSSASDTSAGTGARTIYILGINGTGAEIAESVTLNGTSGVMTIHAYTAIQSITVTSVGSGGANAGDIYVGTGTITAGVPANVHGHVLTGENQSLMGHFTIPAGYTGYMVRGSISSGTQTGAAYVTGRLKLRMDGVVYTAAIVTFSGGRAEFVFEYPIAFPAGSCVSASAVSTGNNEAVSSYFQILLIKNS